MFGLFFVVGTVNYMRVYNFYEVYGNFIDIGCQSYFIHYLKVEYVHMKTLPWQHML